MATVYLVWAKENVSPTAVKGSGVGRPGSWRLEEEMTCTGPGG